MNPRRLIVNADDFGRTAGVSRGIRQAHLKGIVTSTTAMMNMPTVNADLRFAAEETPLLGLGVHLTLTSGHPLSAPAQIPTLVNESGRFWVLDEFIPRLDKINLDEVRLEWRAQADRFIAQTGKTPTHFDSHHHSSYFTPALFRLMLELARDYRCAIRYGIPAVGDPDSLGIPAEGLDDIQAAAPAQLAEFHTPHPDVFLGSFYDQTATLEQLLKLIGTLAGGVSELMCHPGEVDKDLLEGSSYNHQRERELGIVTDTQVLSVVQLHEVELISFGYFD